MPRKSGPCIGVFPFTVHSGSGPRHQCAWTPGMQQERPPPPLSARIHRRPAPPPLHLRGGLHYSRPLTGALPRFFGINDQKEQAIARRPHNAPPTRDTGPRVNERVRAPEIRLIGAEGENIGLITPERAMVLAEQAGLDLVEISPNATPPSARSWISESTSTRPRKKIRSPRAEDHRDQGDQVPPEHRHARLRRQDALGAQVPRGRRQGQDHASLPRPRDGACRLGRKLLERVADDVAESARSRPSSRGSRAGRWS